MKTRQDKQFAAKIRKMIARLANRPTLNQMREYRKQLKKFKKDPAKYSKPKLLRGWWGDE